MGKCKQCGAKVEAGATKCFKCGATTAMGHIRNIGCGIFALGIIITIIVMLAFGGCSLLR